MPIIRKDTVTKESFETRYIKTESCWEWKLAVGKLGYGVIGYGGRQLRAHRLSYYFYVGQIPDGMFVCHKCDNRKCVNPEHLFLGTAFDNMADMVRKGRSMKGRKIAHPKRGPKKYTLLFCKRNHMLTPENSYIDTKGARQCKACESIRTSVKMHNRKLRQLIKK